MHCTGTLAVGAFLLCAAAPAGAHVIEVTASGEAVVISQDANTETARPQPAVAAPVRRNTARLNAIQPHLNDAGQQVELSPALLEAVAWTESRFNPAARSSVGAIGVMQLMPGTAAELGVDPTRPDQNVRGGARYLRAMLIEFDGDLVRALAAYNAGPEAVRRYDGIPPYRETQGFVASVLNYMAEHGSAEAN